MEIKSLFVDLPSDPGFGLERLPLIWINVTDPLYFLGAWDSLCLCKKGSFCLPRVMWAN